MIGGGNKQRPDPENNDERKRAFHSFRVFQFFAHLKIPSQEKPWEPLQKARIGIFLLLKDVKKIAEWEKRVKDFGEIV
jgi:hypothetical protein